LALEAEGLSGQVVNLATGKKTTLRQLLRVLASELGSSAKARHDPPRRGDIRHSVAELRRARKLLGYEARVDLETGLRRTVEWYRQRSTRSAGRR
jgi:nucleoside-diphosphate-sugar epimerase